MEIVRHRAARAGLHNAIERVQLDPVTLDCRIHYRIPLERTLDMASPRGLVTCPNAQVADSGMSFRPVPTC